MANRYWVGGTGTWDGSDTSHWSASSGGSAGASVPTGGDDVFFNASSGAGTVTNSGGACHALNCTGYTGSLDGSLGSMSGDITLSSGGSYSGLIVYVQGTLTLTSAGKSLYQINLASNATYTVTCADALSCVNLVIESGVTLALKNGVTSTVSTFTAPASATNGGLRSTSSGSQATLSDSSGTNTLTYLTVQDVAFTGGATWQLGAGAVDNGNNTGLYVVPPSSSSIDALFALSFA